LNKKVKQLARFSALTYKAKNNAILVIEDFKFDEPKTKEYTNLLQNLNINDRKSLMVLDEPNKNIYLSSRNIQGTKVLTLSELNTYDIMKASNIVFVESSINNLQKDK
jgi:large subunit ribosomal protein L4